MPTAICPECDEEIFVEPDVEQGDAVNCEECDAELILVGQDPVELDLRENADELDDEDLDEDAEDY